MGSVCKASSSIDLMTGFSPAADNLPMVSPGYRIMVSPGPSLFKSQVCLRSTLPGQHNNDNKKINKIKNFKQKQNVYLLLSLLGF